MAGNRLSNAINLRKVGQDVILNESEEFLEGSDRSFTFVQDNNQSQSP